MDKVRNLLKEEKISDLPGSIDAVIYQSNKLGLIGGKKPFAIYGVLSKINFGLPANVAPIHGEQKDNFVVTLIATRDINKGEELQMDYLLDWFDINKQIAADEEYIKQRKWFAFISGVEFNEKLDKITKDMSSPRTSLEEKHKMMQSIYSHGIYYKESGSPIHAMENCQSFEETSSCVMKKNIVDFVASRELFEVINGKRKPPKWTGKAFGKIAKQWRDLQEC